MGSRRLPTAPVQPTVGSLVSGARSSRVVEPVAASVAEQILAGAPYLRAPQYRMAVEALAVNEARLRLVDAAVAERGLWNRKGRPWAFVEYGWRLERLCDNLRQSLGLTPASRARLGRQVAAAEYDAARVWSGMGGQGQATQPEPAGAVTVTAEPAPAKGDTVPEVGAGEPGGPAGGRQ